MKSDTNSLVPWGMMAAVTAIGGARAAVAAGPFLAVGAIAYNLYKLFQTEEEIL